MAAVPFRRNASFARFSQWAMLRRRPHALPGVPRKYGTRLARA